MTEQPSAIPRAILRNRRPTETLRVRSIRLDKTLHISVSYFRDNSIAEVFVSGAKVGSDSESLLAEWATLLSIALQRGMTLQDYAQNIHRERDGTPVSAFGEIIDRLLAPNEED